MIDTYFIEIVIGLVVSILVIGLLGTVSNSRFVRTTHRDRFRNKKQIGKQNLGKLQDQKTYREIAKKRDLEEAKLLESKMNPKVTRSIATVTKDVRKREEKKNCN